LYGDAYVGTSGLDSHKAFIVSYRMGQDIDLAYHYDNAEITVNISLNDEFNDGDLYFGTMAKQNRTSFSNFTCVSLKLSIMPELKTTSYCLSLSLSLSLSFL
jgi:hypothetical protein